MNTKHCTQSDWKISGPMFVGLILTLDVQSREAAEGVGGVGGWGETEKESELGRQRQTLRVRDKQSKRDRHKGG